METLQVAPVPSGISCTRSPLSASPKEHTLYIMRGLSGSGKSTLAKKLWREHGGVILSTDDYFMKDGTYKWDGRQLREAHQWNQRRAVEAYQRGISPVIIDNTNTQKWEAKFYVQQGLAYGYNVEIVEPTTPWRRDPKELSKRNNHGVSEEVIYRMLQRWEDDFTVSSILDCAS